ncbi:MAG: tRNA (adenosine(37)-N6)-threonylcarbamoyltransferase complex ATPase subunit type 1 TsaE [Lentimicrobiaceae bacterium]|nr:tRNA (adenosine(37)-N6)-threonylcarbamoyltransferase complex ATPase subunit type 1 TsaE [Lentimicrobiaceae bacterium]
MTHPASFGILPLENQAFCSDVHELEALAGRILASSQGQHIFALQGAMGAGKTTFIKALCKSLGVTDNVTSPTFSLVNEYRDAVGSPIYHFDFYRIKNIQEVMDMGYEDYFFSGHRCFLEWPELIPELLPTSFVYIKIVVQEDEVRQITWGIMG